MATTLVWAANNIGSGWNTEAGSATFQCVGGETIVVYQNGLANADQGLITLRAPDGTTVTPKRQAGAFNSWSSSATTYGGYSTLENVRAGTYVVNPFAVTGGNDGVIRVYTETGMPSALLVRTYGKLPQAGSSQSITVTTVGNVQVGDHAFGGRCHENSVGSTDTITPPSGWTSDIQYLNGTANLPTDVSHLVVASGGGSQLSATWTSADTAITDTSAAVLVLTPIAMAFSTLPIAANTSVGGFATFTVAITGASGTAHYQWTMDGVNVGQDSGTLTLQPTVKGSHTIGLTVTDSIGSIAIQPITMLVFAAQKPRAHRSRSGDSDDSGMAWLTRSVFDPSMFDPSNIPSPTGSAGVVKTWNGAWTSGKPVKAWVAGAWVTKPAKRYNGSTWQTLS